MRRLLLPVLLLLVALTAGIWLGGHPDRLPAAVRDTLVEPKTAVVGEALGVLDRRYFRSVPQRSTQEAAIRGAVDSLGDQFSTYLSPKELVAFDEVTNARFDGIGVEIQPAVNGLKIVRVYENSPAETAGLKADDVIVRAADKSLAGLSTHAASGLIRGASGTLVELTWVREDRRITRKVKREQVRVPVVASRYDRRSKVAVVRLGGFSTDANVELRQAIKRAVKQGATGIVLDLRSNPGGLVSEAQKVASLFLDGGTIVTTRGRAVRTRTLKADNDPAFPKLPVVMLVDRNSASAAEIVAGALQDRKRARVLGTRTYGKGVYQEIIPLGSGGALDITVGQYFTPKGRNLGGAGVTKGKDTSRGKGIAPDAPAVDKRSTPNVDEAEAAAIKAVQR